WTSEFGCLNTRCLGGVGRPMAKDLETGEIWPLASDREAGGVWLVGRVALWRALSGRWVGQDLETRTPIDLPPEIQVVGSGGGELLVRLPGGEDDMISLYDPLTGTATSLESVPTTNATPVTSSILYSPELGLLVWAQGSPTAQLMIRE